MDIERIHSALNGTIDLFDLNVAERMVFAREVIRAELRRPITVRDAAPRFVVPEAIERLYRGASS
jgi:hypothetical protein